MKIRRIFAALTVGTLLGLTVPTMAPASAGTPGCIAKYEQKQVITKYDTPAEVNYKVEAQPKSVNTFDTPSVYRYKACDYDYSYGYVDVRFNANGTATDSTLYVKGCPQLYVDYTPGSESGPANTCEFTTSGPR